MSITGKFEKGDKAIIIGGVVDSTGITETSVTVCMVVEVGEADLLVKLDRASAPLRIVSKATCIPIRTSPAQLSHSQTLQPSLGDMVYYCGKISWRDEKETTCVGTVYEIKFRDGAPVTATIHTGSDMIGLPYSELLVLQKSLTL